MARRSKKQIIEDAFASGVFAKQIEVVDGAVSLISNFNEYGTMVNRERSIPDVRDGLILVQRRAMMTVHDLRMKTNNLKGSAEFVGSAMRFHPHSDDALYQAVKKLAQPDRHPVPIMEFQGNQGNLHEVGASLRYTYLKPNAATLAMLGHDDETTARNEIDFQGVPIGKNFNGEYDEAEVMPAMFPNYLINGHDNGIGVGKKTEIPKHNAREVMDLALHLLKLGSDNIRTSTLMKILPGPDFPTSDENDEHGVDIIDSATNGIESYLTTGIGMFVMQAPYHLEEYRISKRDVGTKIVFDQLPYAVSTEKVRESFDKMQEKGLIPDSVRMDIERQVIVDIHKYDAEDVLPYLYAYTPLRSRFHAKMLANLPDGTPSVIGAVEAISEWLDHRKKTVRHASAHRIEAWSDERANAEVTLLAIKHARWLTEVSLEHDDPSGLVAEKLEITKDQAQYLLNNTTFSRLSDKRKQSLLDKVDSLTEKIEFHQSIIDDDDVLNEEIKRQIMNMRKQFGAKRKCQIISADDDLYNHTPKGAMVKEPPKKGFLAIGENGTIRFALRDNIARETNDDYFTRMVPTTDAESLFCVTNAGYVGRIPMKDIPREATKINWHMINAGYDLEQGEEILSIHTSGEIENKYLALMTSSGRLKVVDMAQYEDMRAGFKPALTIDLNKEDSVVGAALFSENDTVGALTSTGKISLYEMVENDTFKPKGSNARATSFVKLASRGGGEIVWFGTLPDGTEKFVFRTNDSFGAFALSDSAWQERVNTIGTSISKITNIEWAEPVDPEMNTICVSSSDFDEREEVRIDTLSAGPLKNLTKVEGSSEVYAVTYLAHTADTNNSSTAE